MSAETPVITASCLLLPAASRPHDVLERMVLRQQKYESRYPETGNDVLKRAVQRGQKNIIYSPDTIPGDIEPNRQLLETFQSPHNQSVIEIFLGTISDQDDKEKIQARLTDIDNNPQSYLPVVYGTSGTEANSKELGNILGTVQWFNSQGRSAVGIYFVEDQGHPLNDTIAQEAQMLALYVAAQKGITVEEAKILVDKADKKFYGGKLYDLYDPSSATVQEAILKISGEEQQKKVLSYFEKCSGALSDASGENLATTAVNIPAPQDKDILCGYIGLGLPENLVHTMAHISQYIYSHPDLFPRPSVADFRTILQGVTGLQLAYTAYGAENMPIWAVETWSSLCKRTGLKNHSLTLSQMKEAVECSYPEQNRRVINFACPTCRTEHGIHTASHDQCACGFEEIVDVLGDIPIENWRWGGNSGVVYYELLNQSLGQGQFVLFVDNYEANGPQSRLVSINQPPLIYPPGTRTWVIGPDMIYKKHGVVDPNGTLGAAPPSELVAAYLSTLQPQDKRTILQRWFEISGESGIENNCGVLKVDFRSAEVKKLPYSILRAWSNLSPESTFDRELPFVVSEETLTCLVEQLPSGTIFQQLEAGILGKSIAKTFHDINSRVWEARLRCRYLEQTIRKIDLTEQIVSQRLHPVNKVGEELQRMRMLSAAEIAWGERERLLAKGVRVESNKPGQKDSKAKLKDCLENGDLKSITEDVVLITALTAEVYDLWTDDFMAQKNGDAPERGICKAEMARQFEQAVKDRAECSPGYLERTREFEAVAQKCQSDILTPFLKQLRKGRKRLTDRLKVGKKSLVKEVELLEKERDNLLWQLLTTVGTRAGLYVQSYNSEENYHEL